MGIHSSLLLLICQLICFASGAYLNVTIPRGNAQVNSTLTIVLDAFDPPYTSTDFDRLKFVYKSSASTSSPAVVSVFNKKLKRFVLESLLPSSLTGRVAIRYSTVNRTEIEISSLKFEDEGSEFYFRLDYYESTTLTPKLSNKLQIQNVYALPVFDAGSMLSSSNVIEGRTSTITCIVRSRPAANVRWTYDNTTINATLSSAESTDGYYTIVTNVITISNPSRSINGKQLTCSAQHQFSFAINRTTAIDVQYLPENTSLMISPPNPKLKQNITLTCYAVGKPAVTRYKFYVNNTTIGNSTTGSLIVNASDCAKYNGRYKCIPESSIGDGEIKSQQIVITDDVKVSVTNPSKTVNETLNVSLTCSVTGCPIPSINWWRDGSPLGVMGTNLLLNNVNKSTSGRYSCHADNGYTNGTAQIQLNVNYKPTGTQFTSSNRKPVENSVVSLNCTTDSVPQAKYRLYRVTSSGDILVSNSAFETSGIYSIASVTYDGDYNVSYKCVPYNILGNGTAVTTSIEIQVQPRVSMSVTPSTVNESQDALIQCRILAANPSPNITIRHKHGAPISHVNGNMTLSSVTREQSGMYICTVDNKVGSAVTRNVTLVVNHTPDQVNITSSNMKPLNGTSVILACTARATPTAKYRFYQKNGASSTLLQDSSRLEYTTNVLDIENLVNFKAVFTCVAYNMMGEGTSNITIDVQVPPKVTLSVTPNNINETDDVVINCTVTVANPRATITLRDPRSQSIGHSNGFATLTNLSRGDAGSYSCEANNGVTGSPVSATALLTVNHAPDNVTIHATTTKPVSGSAVTLTCNARATPKAKYRFIAANGTTIQDSDSNTVMIASLNHQKFTNYTAVFQCAAYNSYGEAPTQEISLNIQVVPVLNVSIIPSTINEFGNATFECKVIAANPQPNITISNPKGQKVSHADGVAALTSVTRDGSGSYSCRADNGVTGSPAEKSATLIVNHKPDQVNLNASVLKPHNGSSVTFRCSSRANPAASYRFYSVSGSVAALLQNSSSATYTIANISYADYTAYKATIRCVPYNSLGDGVAVNKTVDIQVSPQLQVATSMNVTEGQNFNLYCNVTAANPQVSITWRNPAGSSIAHNNGMVRFTSVRRNENGTYTCTASNGIGQNSTKITVLTVYYGPEITTKSGVITACKPDVVTITCSGSGNPVPFMKIIFSNTEKSSSMGKTSYVISDLKDYSFGIYTCIAKNSVNEVSSTTTLQKRAEPGVVTEIKFKSGPGSIEVTWKLPECKGARGINAIRVKYKKKGQSSWKQKDAKSNDVKLTIDGLDKGAEYDVQVFVVDGTGKEHAALQNSARTVTGKDSETGSNAALVGGIAGGVMLLIIIIVVCVAMRKRRRSSSTAESHLALSNGAYGDDTGKKGMDMKELNGSGHYRAPDGSLYASVSKKSKSKEGSDAAVDNAAFIADSDGAYEPVTANNNASTPKQSPASNKKAEGAYAELSSFQPKNGGDKPKDQPAKTEYATLEEMGPLKPFDGPEETEPQEKSPDDPPSHKITVEPESEDTKPPEVQVTDTETASSDSSAKVDII